MRPRTADKNPVSNPHPRHQRTHRVILAASVTTATAMVGLVALLWSLPAAALAGACLAVAWSFAWLASAGEAMTARWHWSIESRHRMEAGQTEWFDLHAYLHRPRWWLRTSRQQRACLVHCVRPYREGGRGTNEPQVVLDWVRHGHGVDRLLTALEHGVSDAALSRHMDGTTR